MEITLHTIKYSKHVQTNSKPDFDAEYDIIVCGIGTAGAIAAIRAAALGLKVLGIDRLTGMGGLGTYGLVWDYFFGAEGGYFEKIDALARSYIPTGFVPSEPKDNSLGNRCIPGFLKERALESYAKDAGLETVYESTITGLYTDQGRVIGVLVFSKGKRRSFKAKYVIDCTGNGLLAQMANVSGSTGRRYDGQCMNTSKPVGYLKEGCSRATWDSAATDATTHTEAAKQILSLNKSKRPFEFVYRENNRMFYDSTMLGRREGMHLSASATLSFADFADGKQAEIPLFYVFTPLDNPNKTVALESEAHRDWAVISRMKPFGFTVGVPAGIFMPKNRDGNEVHGLLCCGLSMGIDHDMSTGFRMKRDFQKCGEAVAQLAALSIAENVPASQVSSVKLREKLAQSGCYNAKNNIGIAKLNFTNNKNKPVHLPDLKDLEACFMLDASDERRALALWSARMRKADIAWQAEILRLLQHKNKKVRTSAAPAGGMLVLCETAPVLLAYLNDDTDCDGADIYAAIDLLGRFKYVPATATLSKIYSNASDFAAERLRFTDTFYCTTTAEKEKQILLFTERALQQINKAR